MGSLSLGGDLGRMLYLQAEALRRAAKVLAVIAGISS